MNEQPKAASLRVDRFMRLPRRSGEVWQGGGVLLPFFISASKDAEPERQAAIAWANLATDDVLMVSATAADARDPGRLLDAFLDLGLKNRKVREGRPARIEVRDEALGAFIKESLGDPELDVLVVPALPRVDSEIDRLIRYEVGEGVDLPGVLEAAGVTVDRLRAFAEAASRVRRREIWHDIGPDDLVMVEAPAAPDGMAGLAADFGSGDAVFRFFDSAAEFELFRDDDGEEEDNEDWHVEFVRLHELPVADVPAWADLDLPVGAPDGYPLVLKSIGGGVFLRPDATRLAFLEGLFRALAETSEAQIDEGRWTAAVDTADGPVTYRLAIPSLLDEPAAGESGREQRERDGASLSRFLDEGHFDTLEDAIEELERSGRSSLEHRPPATDEERAQDLVYRSMGASGRRRTQLLREAIALWPDCFQAYLHLGEHVTRAEQALELFQIGREAAERVLEREGARDFVGHYWEHGRTRSYLRLRVGLALALRARGDLPEASAHLRELLVLDEPDRAGARDYLLAVLLDSGNDEEAAQLIGRYETGGPIWMYGSALLAYRGRSRRDALRRLEDAYRLSPMSAEFLVSEALGPERAEHLGPRDEEVAHGQEDEASECLDLLGSAWQQTPGALAWMATELKRGSRRRR